MAGDDDDFYTRDRPENPDLEEDRPRGGGGEPAGKGALGSFWILYIVVAVVIVIMFVTLI
ncbi:hypothetical protein [Streptomyces sp. NPDC058451]|uniref:hypothetical protein n=1 Tax=unclassified Streptomyces TaxID=2593676 RepID=UPI00365B154D